MCFVSVLWPKSRSLSQEGVWGCWLGLWGGRASSLGTPTWWGAAAAPPPPGQRAEPPLCPWGKSFFKSAVPDLSPAWPRVKTKVVGATDRGEHGTKESSARWWVLPLEDEQRAAAWPAAGGVASKPARRNPQPPRDWKCLLNKIIHPNKQTKSGGGGGRYLSARTDFVIYFMI